MSIYIYIHIPLAFRPKLRTKWLAIVYRDDSEIRLQFRMSLRTIKRNERAAVRIDTSFRHPRARSSRKSAFIAGRIQAASSSSSRAEQLGPHFRAHPGIHRRWCNEATLHFSLALAIERAVPGAPARPCLEQIHETVAHLRGIYVNANYESLMNRATDAQALFAPCLPPFCVLFFF